MELTAVEGALPQCDFSALQTHPHHNYYEGWADADLANSLAYFVRSMTQVFQLVANEVRARAVSQAAQPVVPKSPELSQLDRHARLVPGLFT